MTPGEHSEDIQDHRDNDEILRYIASKHGTDSHMVQMLKNACDEHSEIIERFGRYGLKCTSFLPVWTEDCRLYYPGTRIATRCMGERTRPRSRPGSMITTIFRGSPNLSYRQSQTTSVSTLRPDELSKRR